MAPLVTSPSPSPWEAQGPCSQVAGTVAPWDRWKQTGGGQCRPGFREGHSQGRAPPAALTPVSAPPSYCLLRSAGAAPVEGRGQGTGPQGTVQMPEVLSPPPSFPVRGRATCLATSGRPAPPPRTHTLMCTCLQSQTQSHTHAHIYTHRHTHSHVRIQDKATEASLRGRGTGERRERGLLSRRRGILTDLPCYSYFSSSFFRLKCPAIEAYD